MQNYKPTAEEIKEHGEQMALFMAKMSAIPGLMEKYTELMTNYATDPAVKQKMLDFENKNFEDADANKDGRLDADEYAKYVKISEERSKEQYGQWVQYSDDEIKGAYTVMNKLSAEEGISKDDIKKSYVIYEAMQ